jgi:hypothetical protein
LIDPPGPPPHDCANLTETPLSINLLSQTLNLAEKRPGKDLEKTWKKQKRNFLAIKKQLKSVKFKFKLEIH